MFASGLAAGTHESYFPLVEQFMTQSSPPYCALACNDFTNSSMA